MIAVIMKEKTFNGILASGLGSLWWGVIGVLYFKSVSFVSPIQVCSGYASLFRNTNFFVIGSDKICSLVGNCCSSTSFWILVQRQKPSANLIVYFCTWIV